jgi:RHS repeat-associated protein
VGFGAVFIIFTGKERDSESGLEFFGARFFAGSLGRFLSPDDPLIDQDPTIRRAGISTATCEIIQWVQRICSSEKLNGQDVGGSCPN